MSFKLTYKDLGNPNFVSGVKKLLNADHYTDTKRAYNLSRLGVLLDQELKTFYGLREKLTLKIKAAKPENNGSPTEADKALLDSLELESDQFNAMEITIERHKIHFDDIAPAKLTPNEIGALEPLLEGLPS